MLVSHGKSKKYLFLFCLKQVRQTLLNVREAVPGQGTHFLVGPSHMTSHLVPGSLVWSFTEREQLLLKLWLELPRALVLQVWSLDQHHRITWEHVGGAHSITLSLTS